MRKRIRDAGALYRIVRVKFVNKISVREVAEGGGDSEMVSGSGSGSVYDFFKTKQMR